MQSGRGFQPLTLLSRYPVEVPLRLGGRMKDEE